MTRVDLQRRFYDATRKGLDGGLILVEDKAFSLEGIAAAALPRVALDLVELLRLMRVAGAGADELLALARHTIGRSIELSWSELVKACPVCRSCGRWNYHLAGCAARAAELAQLRAIGVLR